MNLLEETDKSSAPFAKEINKKEYNFEILNGN